MTRTIAMADVLAAEEQQPDSRLLAETLTAWADDGTVGYQDISAAGLLSLAGGYFRSAGDARRGAEQLARARELGGDALPDVEAVAITGLARRGDRDTAVQLADELRRRGVREVLSYPTVAESLVRLEAEKPAMRWLNMAIRALERELDADPEDEDLDELLSEVLLTRYDLRRAAGLPKDGYDEEADLILDAPLHDPS